MLSAREPVQNAVPPDREESAMTDSVRRRELLGLIGRSAGGAAMLHAMTALGHAEESPYAGRIDLPGAPPGMRILVLGAGMAGLIAAYELRRAGYAVEVLEYNERAGGRSWTLRGGDEYVELGGAKQRCEFDRGLYFNPGPWRIPYHHHAMLDYARRLGVALEPFVQVNHNAYLYAKNAWGGAPQRLRHVQSDFHGHVAELLAKATRRHALDDAVTREDQERLLEAMRRWGALDRSYRYAAGELSSSRRGHAVAPGGGLMPSPVPSQPLALHDLLQSRAWTHLVVGLEHEYQSTLLQPVGGMDQIARALHREVADAVRFGARVTAIDQDPRGVTVTYADMTAGGATRRAQADWCVCTIPLSILSQIEIKAGAAMHAAIDAVPYGASVKVGLQFKRRFWEEDDRIYGGITYTDQPIGLIGYPDAGVGQAGKGVLLGAYIWGPNAYEFTSLTPQERVQLALAQGARIHPQYPAEFETGISVGWHRVPWSLGCYGAWSDAARAEHYRALCEIDGRIVLAGEHASLLPAWQEGAVLSSLDAITRLHARITAKA
jgi:monoamine oxidase